MAFIEGLYHHFPGVETKTRRFSQGKAAKFINEAQARKQKILDSDLAIRALRSKVAAGVIAFGIISTGIDAGTGTSNIVDSNYSQIESSVWHIATELSPTLYLSKLSLDARKKELEEDSEERIPSQLITGEPTYLLKMKYLDPQKNGRKREVTQLPEEEPGQEI